MKQSGKSSQDSFLVHIYNRYKAETPKFFKKILYFMCSLTTLGVALIGYSDQLPESLKSVGGYCIAIGAVGAFLSKLTIVDVPIEKEKEG